MAKSKLQVQKTSPAEIILHELAADGDWHSGEDLAERLGMTRAGVSKHIRHLREEGHIIESVTKRGYRLLVKNDPVSRDSIQPYLKTKTVGRREWKSLDETSSTNTAAIALALDGAEAGSIVTAARQTRGKGRKGDDWFSSPHSLQFSVVLRPGKLDEHELTQTALAAVRQAILDVAGIQVDIKQPNDIHHEGKKLCGVLVESGRRGEALDWVVLGIGVNVNVPAADFPENLRERITSLYAVTGKAADKNRLLARILTLLEIM
jgi:birA, biotin-[acetyl-CoA-carboxylase] ligase region